MELAALGRAFYGRELLAARMFNFEKARAAGGTINQNGACAAVAFPAPVLGAGQPEICAQNPKQAALAIDTKPHRTAIQFKRNCFSHKRLHSGSEPYDCSFTPANSVRKNNPLAGFALAGPENTRSGHTALNPALRQLPEGIRVHVLESLQQQ